MYYHLPCQTQPYESDSFSISVTSAQLSATQTAVFQGQGCKNPNTSFSTLPYIPLSLYPSVSELPSSHYLFTSHHLFTFISQNPPPSPTSPIFLYHLFLIFLLQCFQTSASGCLTCPCQAVSDAGLGWGGRTCALARGLHMSVTNWAIWPPFRVTCFSLLPSKPFFMAKRIVQHTTNCATLLLGF